MTGYILTDPARDHLRSIWREIAQQSLQGADHVIDRVIASCEHLGAFFTEGELWLGRPAGLRCYPVPRTKYVIVFVPDTDPLEIIAVIHSSREQSNISLG